MISSHAKMTPMPTKNQQIFASKDVINFQMEFGVLWNDKCMLILKNEHNQISWGNNSHINDHKKNLTYACNDYYINIIIAKDF